MSDYTPIVSVILAVRDGRRYLDQALQSLLRQTLAEIELLVIDDASTDDTPELLARIRDPRLTVFRNETRRGLASSLNLALDNARGRYVARLDADDVAMPDRLERQLAHMRAHPELAVLGSAVLDVDDRGRVGGLHEMPRGFAEVRWAALFSSPHFHPTVLVDRDVLERHGFRYDAGFEESEDYDLWTRLLAVAEGDNLPEPLVLYRVHAGQASQRRRLLQRELQERVALREIGRVAPDLTRSQAELAWRVGSLEPVAAERLEDAAEAFVALVRAFEREGYTGIRKTAARRLARCAASARGSGRAVVLAQALRLDPALAGHLAVDRLRRRRTRRSVQRRVDAWLAQLDTAGEGARPIRVAAVFPEPTPYRAPLLDRIGARDEVDLTVIYAAATVAGRTWTVEPRHRAVYLRGVRIPGAERVLHHDYPVTPGVARALERARPEVVVVSGWSTFAAQGAIAWCRTRGVPYALVVESHDEGPRPGWRRRVKGTVVPSIVRGASGILAVGTLAARSMTARGAPAGRVRIFANTIDVQEFGERAAELAARRPQLRESVGAGPEDVVVLSVGRLAREKRLDLLVRAVVDAGDPRLLLVLVGEGRERAELETLCRRLDARVALVGDMPWERIVETYVLADVFALLSERETWGVAVNEAAACGLPLLLSDRVGAAHDLLHDGDNGVLVPGDDVEAAARALRLLAADSGERRRMGARSLAIAASWGYEPSVEAFVATVREAVVHSGARSGGVRHRARDSLEPTRLSRTRSRR